MIIHYDSSVKSTIGFIRQLELRITNSSIKKALEYHPDYPSLLSIYDTLQHFNIKTLAINADKERVNEFPLPFLAHITSKGGSFVTVYSTSNNFISYYHDDKKNKGIVISKEEFFKIWSGKTLIVNGKPNFGESNYAIQKVKELLQNIQIPAFLFGLLICGVFSNLNSFATNPAGTYIQYSLLLFSFFSGLIVSSMLLWYEVDNTNTTLHKICSIGKKTNCKAILNSKYSKLLGFLSWSEIGFYYFLGGYLSLIINGTVAIQILTFLNFMALPYIIFSIYYQWRVAKQWCILCLLIQFVLFIQGVVNISFPLFPMHTISSVDITNFALAYLIPVSIWGLLKPSILLNKELRPKAKELSRLKANSTIFHSILQKQKRIANSVDGLGILLGNPQAENSIVKVCNPFCGPCAQAHPILDDILHHNSNINARVIFMTSSDDSDLRTKTAKHLMAIKSKYGESVIPKAMDDWYNAPIKDYDKFSALYPVSDHELEEQNQNIAAMILWCEEINIQYTPTLFINGYQLPESIYGMEDIKYLLS